MPSLNGPQIGPLTPNSAANPFCMPTDFVVIFDWRTIAELLSDTDAALTNQAAVINSPILNTLLMQGAGQIEMATSRGNRYQPSDLTTLAASGTVAGQRLKRLNAAITMEMCWRRRPDKEMPPMPEFDEAEAILGALENGEKVFGFVETMNAGMLQEYEETGRDVRSRNLPSYIAQNLFGRRGNRINRPPA